MDKLQAARILNPGTAWSMSGNVLEQAVDGTPRVTVPKDSEIQAIIDANAPTDQKIAWQTEKSKGQTQALSFIAKQLGLE